MSVPQFIFSDDQHQDEYTIKETLSINKSHLYHSNTKTIDPQSDIKVSFLVSSNLVESKFKRKFIEPTAKIIEQGRWECGAAALAMLLGESLWNVKRALAKVGWNNDDRGVTSDKLIKAGLSLGYELIFTDKVKDHEPCLVTVPSLNVVKRTHAVCWTGQELLDPNLYDEKRKHYSPEWSLNALNRFDKVIRFKRQNEKAS